MPYCSNCGRKLYADDRYCSGCGRTAAEVARGSFSAEQDTAASVITEGRRPARTTGFSSQKGYTGREQTGVDPQADNKPVAESGSLARFILIMFITVAIILFTFAVTEGMPIIRHIFGI